MCTGNRFSTDFTDSSELRDHALDSQNADTVRKCLKNLLPKWLLNPANIPVNHLEDIAGKTRPFLEDLGKHVLSVLVCVFDRFLCSGFLKKWTSFSTKTRSISHRTRFWTLLMHFLAFQIATHPSQTVFGTGHYYRWLYPVVALNPQIEG